MTGLTIRWGKEAKLTCFEDYMNPVTSHSFHDSTKKIKVNNSNTLAWVIDAKLSLSDNTKSPCRIWSLLEVVLKQENSPFPTAFQCSKGVSPESESEQMVLWFSGLTNKSVPLQEATDWTHDTSCSKVHPTPGAVLPW